MTEAVIAGIPDGVYAFEDALEGDGQREFSIPIHASITVQGSKMTVDFSGSAPQVAGNLNAVAAIVRSATWYCVRLLAQDELPLNHGCFEPVTVITPSHSLLNPDFPAAVAVGNTETGQRLVDVVLGALAKALPSSIPAASLGTMNNVTVGGSVNGKQFIYYETIGGGHGGGPLGAGISGRHSHMTNTRNTPVEALEYTLPLRVRTYTLRSDSGGTGTHQGGSGIRREYEFLAAATVTVNSERRLTPPYGLRGGAPGLRGRNVLVRDGVKTEIGGKWTGTMLPGDRLLIETPGGGGWGTSEPNRTTHHAIELDVPVMAQEVASPQSKQLLIEDEG
jgi:N-methylhydantoinase B